MDEREKALTAALRRHQILEQKAEELRREIAVTEAKIAAVEALRGRWSGNGSYNEAQRDD